MVNTNNGFFLDEKVHENLMKIPELPRELDQRTKDLCYRELEVIQIDSKEERVSIPVSVKIMLIFLIVMTFLALDINDFETVWYFVAVQNVMALVFAPLLFMRYKKRSSV